MSHPLEHDTEDIHQNDASGMPATGMPATGMPATSADISLSDEQQEKEIPMLTISEIFYSIQGEGGRAGTINVFIRTQGCKAQNACYAAGIRCDTEFESGRAYHIQDIEAMVRRIGGICKNIIWTGGEPLQQLTDQHVAYFKRRGYYQACETSGLFPPPDGLDYIACSPKVAEHVLEKNFRNAGHRNAGHANTNFSGHYQVHELRYVRHQGQDIPKPRLKALYYCISPHSDGMELNGDNLKHCIELCKNNPQWALSLQMHKVISVL